jgi:hypothetical protein
LVTVKVKVTTPGVFNAPLETPEPEVTAPKLPLDTPEKTTAPVPLENVGVMVVD